MKILQKNNRNFRTDSCTGRWFWRFWRLFFCVFPEKTASQGYQGLWEWLAALVLLVIYSLFLRRLTPWYTDPIQKPFGAAGGRIIGVIFLSYVALTGAYLLDLMDELVPAVLITGIPGIVISFLAAAGLQLWNP